MTRRIAVGQIRRIAEEERKVQQDKTMSERDRYRQHPVPRLCKHPTPVKSVVTNIAVPVSKVLAKMEYEGIRVDRPYLADLYTKLGDVIDNTERELYKIAGKDLKLNSAAAIANLLFNEGYVHPDTGQRVYYPSESKTRTGQDQTTEKVLKALVKKYKCPFSAKKLIYSKAYKAKNTFCQNVLDLSALDGFLHTNYNIHGTGTGRLSSNDENMQNIPKKLAGHSIKSIFIPSDDSMAFVNADAKGAEIRIFTAYSRDAELIKAINDGLDTHAFFASKIVEAVRAAPNAAEVLMSMGLDDAYPLIYEDFDQREMWKIKDPKYGEMLDKFRTAVKRVVFGILYGAGPAKIAETIGISKAQAKAIIDLLFSMFPSIPRYMEETKWELRQFGMVETYFGRRRRFAMKGVQGMLRARAERQAVNFKIQSTSSDIVLGRLVDVAAPLERDLQGRLLLTVHDSIGFELPKRYLSQLPDFISEHLVKQAGIKHPWLPVDFKWDFEVGNSYGSLMPFEEYMKGITTTEETRNEFEEAYDEEEVRTDLASVDAA
jgi:DNA polymerase-1